MKKRFVALLFAYCCCSGWLLSQDFIMQGCYWSCPEDAPGSLPDSATLDFWMGQLAQQAPELTHAGFTAIWLPNLTAQSPPSVQQLMRALQAQGLQPIAEIDLKYDTLGGFTTQALQLHQSMGIRSFSVNDYASYAPQAFEADLQTLVEQGVNPAFVIRGASDFDANKTQQQWLIRTLRSLRQDTASELSPRIYDYQLREALRRACSDTTYDVRNIFDSSIRDLSALSGHNIITLANHPAYKNQNGEAGDWDDPMADPLLAYAYLLTNNQVGLPTVFYGDYYGGDSQLEGYLEKSPLRTQIDQMLEAHRQFIFNSTTAEYLNQKGSLRRADYYSGDSTRTLIYQLEGTQTPAGLKNRGHSPKDVLVAINFSMDTLDVLHEINTANLAAGDYFTDVTGNAALEKMELMPFGEGGDGLRAVRLQLPPRAYAIWVQGRAPRIQPSRVQLAADPYPNYIELTWEVAYERKVMGYQIERSVNGGDYQTLGTLPPLANDNGKASFLFLDKDIYPGEALAYRIKLVDKDGKHEYSPVATASPVAPALKFEWREHPEHHAYTFRMKSNYSTQGELVVYDAEGQTVHRQPQRIQKGDNITKVDLSRLSRGVYYVRFSTEEEEEVWSTKVLRL